MSISTITFQKERRTKLWCHFQLRVILILKFLTCNSFWSDRSYLWSN